MRSMRRALGSFAALLAFAALPSSADLEESDSLFQKLGGSPIYCASVAALEAAESVREVSEFVGAGPKSCSVDGGDLSCTWHAVRRTPGYISLARITRTPGKKTDMTCEFRDHGQTRESGTCHAYIAGETPPGADQVAGCQ